MPELPEVEIYARYFARHALGQRIARVRVLDERILGAVRKDEFARALRGRTFTRVRRHGKHLFAEAVEDRRPRLSDVTGEGACRPLWLHLHFGMSGDLSYDRGAPPRFARVVFDFDGGAHLAFEDMRLFGVADTIDDPDAFIRQHALGPDPLSMRLGDFRHILDGRHGAIKSLLMSQNVIAGVGNLYADEALFQSSIAPRRAVDRLSSDERKLLFTNLRKILLTVIERRDRGADHPPRYLIHHREEGARCPRCGGTIVRSIVFGRTTYSCARHQR